VSALCQPLWRHAAELYKAVGYLTLEGGSWTGSSPVKDVAGVLPSARAKVGEVR
jgi:hypothetical protein